MNVSTYAVAKYKAKLHTIKTLTESEVFAKQSHIATSAKVDANLVGFLVQNGILEYDSDAKRFKWDNNIPVTDRLAETVCVKVRRKYEKYRATETVSVQDEEPTDAERFMYLVFIAGFVVGVIVGIFAFLLIFN